MISKLTNLRHILLSASRLNKKLLVASCDFISICLATCFALHISDFDFMLLSKELFFRFLIIPLSCLVIFWYVGVYSSVVRYMDISVIFIISKAVLITTLLIGVSRGVVSYLLNYFEFKNFDLIVNLDGWVVGFLAFAFLLFFSRFLAHFFLTERGSEIKVAIYGAGSAGIQLASALRVSKELQPIAFLDKNRFLHNTFIGGIEVLHPKMLDKLVRRKMIDEVLIAMPSVDNSVLRNLLKEIEDYSIKVRILPGLAELAQGKVLVSELKEVDIHDLLGRLEIEANHTLINKNIAGKVVLITGAGGSIGSEISRQVVENNVQKLILLDSNEYALYSIKKEIESYEKDVEIYSVLGSITNKERITEVCRTFNVNTIYHAAAYKHVSIVEENPFEAVFNNIIGTKSCAEAAIEAQVETFVLISTDKAVRPTNIMGATKRFSELILQSLSPNDFTRMIMVRFGNVIGSSGSAIPLFQKQIKDGGPVTVTHPEVIRYFMSIPEAAELVIQAGAMGQGGDVFVLDMGEPVKIYELAKKLIKLSGMEVRDKENPDGDIEIIFTGLRPGEKLYEELLIGDNVSTTEHNQILRAEEDQLSAVQISYYLELLEKTEEEGDVFRLRDILKEAVIGYSPESEIVDVLLSQK